MWLLLGDPHIEARNLALMKQAADDVLRLIDDKKPDVCVVLGDTLHTHEKVYVPALAQAVEWFRAIAERCRLIVLIGNHDRINNQDFMSSVHPFVGLSHDNITVVDRSLWDADTDCLFVPYVPPGRFADACSHAGYVPGQARAPKYVFAHQEFRGCRMGEIQSSIGDAWSAEWPLVYSGHIHKYHRLPGVVYVGTFHQQTYGEDPDKAVMLVHNDGTEERVRLPSVPRRVTVHMTPDDLATTHETVPTDCLVRVVLSVDATEKKAVEKRDDYKLVCSLADKVTVVVTDDKANVAQSMMRGMKEDGRIEDKPSYSIDEIVRGMLANDPESLSLYETEIR